MKKVIDKQTAEDIPYVIGLTATTPSVSTSINNPRRMNFGALACTERRPCGSGKGLRHTSS